VTTRQRFILCLSVCTVLVGSAANAFKGTTEKQVIRLPLSAVAPEVDGRLAPSEYADAVVLGGSFKGWGISPRPQSPTVYLKRTADRLFILYDNPLKPGERPSMRGAVPDNPGICMGNAIELFFLPHLPDGELLQYVQVAANAVELDRILERSDNLEDVLVATRRWANESRGSL